MAHEQDDDTLFLFHDEPSVFHVKLVFMGGNRPLISLSFIAEGAKWLVCPDQGMAMVVPAPSYRQAKTARVQATFSIPFHSTPNYPSL